MLVTAWGHLSPVNGLEIWGLFRDRQVALA